VPGMNPDRLVAFVTRRRSHLPRWVNRTIDHIADNPDSALGRIVTRRFGKIADGDLPEPVRPAPGSDVTVLIGAQNYAGQARAWSRALTDRVPGWWAANIAKDVPGGFGFDADRVIPLAAYHNSPVWQRQQFEAALEFDHVIVEGAEPVFGRLLGRDVAREITALRNGGVDVSVLFHGTDIRLPSRHAGATPWSPFTDSHVHERLERKAIRSAQIVDDLRVRTFVSTPDLLADRPDAIWLPVVIDVTRFSVERDDCAARLRVMHVPSNPVVKGTGLIAEPMRRVVDQGLVSYEQLRGIASSQMPSVYAENDVVLDQFRLGSYGVAACEAMAAGCVVVSHVTEFVRSKVEERVGMVLPIVEATPDNLAEVLTALAADAGLRREIAGQGRAFVGAIHDGGRSAAILSEALGSAAQGAR